MVTFKKIFDQAVKNSGMEVISSHLPEPRTDDELRKIPDNNYFSLMSRRIFRAGLKHSMVDARWQFFEEVFYNFDIDKVRMMSDEELESLMKDKRIIRHWGKIKSVRFNAQGFSELLCEHQSFGCYLCEWPATQTIHLWSDIKSRFKQLGGQSGSYFLRMSGKDTFVLTKDVLRALDYWGVIDGEPRGKRGLLDVQEYFNAWTEESNRPQCQVSMILAMSI